MAPSIEKDFLSSFHSISGTTIGERRKNLFLLLNKTPETESINFASLQPKTFLEESFKVDALIHFRKVPELLEILMSENGILIHKVLNQSSWFIEQAFDNISGEELVNKIFPNLSFHGKLKLLNKLSFHLKDSQKADEFFKSIDTKYGVYLASKLLPACSEVLLMECLRTNNIEITPKQLLIIIQKYPKLTESIFERLNEYCNISFGLKYKKVFLYLVKHDLELFLKLSPKYEIALSLGHRATNSFICKEKSTVLSTSKSVYKFLKKRQIGKTLKGDFEKFYFNIFPRSLSISKTLLDDHLILLKFLNLDARKLKLIMDTFKAVHGSELWEYSDFVSNKQLIELMDVEERDVWMKNRSRPDEITEEMWVSLMKTDISIPWIKEKISTVSKIKDRQKLVESLVLTCKVNKDNSALGDVCTYMMQQLKNDNEIVRQQFLMSLRYSVLLSKADEKCWKTIIDFITLARLKGERCYLHIEIYEECIYRSLERKLPVRELLFEWVKIAEDRYNICQKKPEYEKQCLLMFNETFPAAYDEEDLNRRSIRYLYAIADWNRRYPHDKVSFFINEEAIRFLKLNLETQSDTYSEEFIASPCIMFDVEKSEDAGLLELIFNKMSSWYFGFKFVNWFVKDHPLLVLKYMEPLTSGLIKMKHNNCCLNIRLFKYYDHLEIPQKMTKICQDVIKNHDDFRRKSAIIGLSRTMLPKDFLSYAASYYPTQLTLNVENLEEQSMYKMQRALIPCYCNITPPSLTLVPILNFCKGDYLNLTQATLHSILNNTNENKLDGVFDILEKRAVSVRKHALLLGIKLLDKVQLYKMFNRFMENEKNASIRKNMFRCALKFFFRNSDEISWSLLKKTKNAVDSNDDDTLKYLTLCTSIPPTFFERYFVFTWEILEKFENPPAGIQDGTTKMLNLITPVNIILLPDEFCQNIIKKYLFKPKTSVKVYSFVSKYLIYRQQQEKHITSVISEIKKYTQSNLHDVDAMRESRQNIFDFIKEFCSNFTDDACVSKETLKIFLNIWNDCFEPHESLEEYLYLEFAQLYLNKSAIAQIALKIVEICNFLNDKESFVFSIVSKTVHMFKDKLLTTDFEEQINENTLILIDNIVKSSKCSSPCLIIAISLLPVDKLMTSKMKVMYDEIIHTIIKEGNRVVQVHLYHYLNNQREDKENNEWFG